MYEKCGMNTYASGVTVEWVRTNSSRWLGHVERMGSGGFVKVHDSELESSSRRGRLLGRWKDKVEGYLRERY